MFQVHGLHLAFSQAPAGAGHLLLLQLISHLLVIMTEEVYRCARTRTEPVAVTPDRALLTHQGEAPGAFDQAAESGRFIAFLTACHQPSIADFDVVLYT
jgi:hypothetical protein